MDNRAIAAERYIDERQYEAMRAVSAARLQHEALEGAGSAGRGQLSRIIGALQRVLNPLRARGSRRVPVRVEVRRS